VVTIPVGFCIIFRGNLVHCGMTYTSDNYRRLCYLVYGSAPCKPDFVMGVLPSKIYECQHCGAKMNSSALMPRHRRLCERNPNSTINRVKKRRSDMKRGMFAYTVCDKTFDVESTCRSHVFREHN